MHWRFLLEACAFRLIILDKSKNVKNSLFYSSYASRNIVNVETLLARVWGGGKPLFPSAPDAGKQRLYIHVKGGKAVISGYPRISFLFSWSMFIA